MTMTEQWVGGAIVEAHDAKRVKRQAGNMIDPALRAVLDKPDDRLLRDVGLTRESVLGEAGRFWFEWSRRSDPWTR